MDERINTVFTFLLHDRTGKLLATFLSFVLVQLVFGAIYFRLFHHHRGNFTFNADILRTQSSVVGVQTKEKIITLRQVQSIITELVSELNLGIGPIKKHDLGSVTLPSGCKCTIEFVGAFAPAGGSPADGPPDTGCRFYVVDSQGQQIFSREVPVRRQNPAPIKLISSRTEWQKLIPYISCEVTSSLESEERRLASLSTETPDVWSYWDFLYFSTIVQTTVGFGDILPNSTAIRMIVTLQIVIGYGLVIVVLNIVLG